MAIAQFKTTLHPWTQEASDAAYAQRERLLPRSETPFGLRQMQYADPFRQAHRNLGQVNASQDVIGQGTQDLFEAFTKRVYEKTGQLPSDEQAKSFMAQTLTVPYAQKYTQAWQGNDRSDFNKDQITAQYVDPYLAANQTDFTPPAPTTPTTPSITGIPAGAGGNPLQDQALQDRLDKLFGAAAQSATTKLNDIFGARRGEKIDEEAALGRLRSPVSEASLGAIDAQKSKAISDAIAGLAGEQATGQLGVSSALNSIFANEREAALNRAQSASQFGKTLDWEKYMFGQNLQKDQAQLDEEARLRREALATAITVGKLGAQKNRDWVDYADLGVRAADTAIKGWRTYKGL